jgi:hypothetical protein
VEAKAWQAFYATLLLERSKFGLNELLGAGSMIICADPICSGVATGSNDGLLG